MPCKQASPTPAVYVPRIPSASKKVSTEAKRSGQKYELGDFFCETCGFSALTVPLPFDHHCPGASDRVEKMVRYRRAACENCPANESGTCLDCKDRFPDRPCSTEYAINNLNIVCPRRKFLSHAMECPGCGYRLASLEGVTGCHRCGWQGHSHDGSWQWKLRDETYPTPKSSRCVLAIATNEDLQQQLEVTGPRMERYAKRCGADFLVLKGDHFPEFGLWNKFRASKVASIYERTLFLDCDVLIQGDPPSLFEVVPEGVTAMYDESPDMNLEFTRKKARQIAEVFDTGGWVPDHEFNSGVTMLPKQHAEAWSPPPKPVPGVWTSEQIWLQCQLVKMGAEIMDLGWRWNCSYFTREFWNRIKDAYFIHLAGSQMPHRLHLLKRFAAGNFKPVRVPGSNWPAWNIR